MQSKKVFVAWFLTTILEALILLSLLTDYLIMKIALIFFTSVHVFLFLAIIDTFHNKELKALKSYIKIIEPNANIEVMKLTTDKESKDEQKEEK